MRLTSTLVAAAGLSAVAGTAVSPPVLVAGFAGQDTLVQGLSLGAVT